MQLTQKESSLIKDLKGQEQLCIDKYTKHAECASDLYNNDDIHLHIRRGGRLLRVQLRG